MRAAYLYLDATYESPGMAASAFGVERQHVNYYVRKLTFGGIEQPRMFVRSLGGDIIGLWWVAVCCPLHGAVVVGVLCVQLQCGGECSTLL